MTTSGGENWHPNGKRGFTDREFACLQGFSLQHRFGPNGIKRQIGNAVPPVVAKVLFEGIRRFMEGVDGIVRDDGGGDGGVGDEMDIYEDVEGVQIVEDDHEVEIVDLSEEMGERGSAEDNMDVEVDDEVQIVGSVNVVRHIVID